MNEDRATRYHRLKRQASIASLVWRVGLLGGVLWSGLSFTLRRAAESAASGVGVAGAWNFCASVAFYVALLAVKRAIRQLAARSGEVVRYRSAGGLRRHRPDLFFHPPLPSGLVAGCR